ncbi:hypothetical protein EXN48_19240 [Clostridium botulinum]|uniref:Uncharacterized protein n=1 Tax=Clostridium botulinum TaxID=1491 RepID=A0A6B3Z893_CLOBO|nr:hypothetical protein RSJ13_09010 [Clostridium botulinum]AUN08859.1 hypothetical protein RSJ14_09430 [Clostridium botulinum]AUN12686.1 hypothetical protein RSJ6_11765 [Clostridium botulinum]AUN19614.1 hypothetical protein B2M06_09180 [Clostridium botulinum]AUN23656.1 hypothetical protein RSJ22_09525 [Clostridium botulinum]
MKHAKLLIIVYLRRYSLASDLYYGRNRILKLPSLSSLIAYQLIMNINYLTMHNSIFIHLNLSTACVKKWY